MLSLFSILSLAGMALHCGADKSLDSMTLATKTDGHGLEGSYGEDNLPVALINNGTHFVYDPIKSRTIFSQIISGDRNRTITSPLKNTDPSSRNRIDLDQVMTASIYMEYCSSLDCTSCAVLDKTYNEHTGYCLPARRTQCIIVHHAVNAKLRTWPHLECQGYGTTLFDSCGTVDAKTFGASGTMSFGYLTC